MKKLNVKMFANYAIGDTSKLVLLKGGTRGSSETGPQAITGKVLWSGSNSNGSIKDVQWDSGHESCSLSDKNYDDVITEN
jgi:hypothetical protein